MLLALCATSAVTTVSACRALGLPPRRAVASASSLTLGVVGLGRIGRMTAERAAPWFGAVVGYDPYLPDAAWPHGMGQLGLEEVFARSSAITLHLP